MIKMLRRAFAANPNTVPASDAESAALTAIGVRQPRLQTYLVWRQSLLLFVVVATLASAGLATYREYTEVENRFDTETMVEELFEKIRTPLDTLSAASGMVGEDGEDEDEEDEAAATEEAAAESPKTAFAKFHEGLELATLYALPVAALLALLFWKRMRLSARILATAFVFSFVTPIVIGFCPWSWWGVDDTPVSLKADPEAYFIDKAEGILEMLQYLGLLLPIVISLVPGMQKACIRVKLLLPQSTLSGWFLVMAAPFYSLFLLALFVGINQFDTHPLFFAGMLTFLAVPFIYVLQANLFTRPATGGDEQRIKIVQRIVGLITAGAGALLVTYLATNEVFGYRLLGYDPKNSLLLPLDIVEFLLATLSKAMFVSVLGADLMMRINFAAWKSTRPFEGTPEAAAYDRVMEEFERL
jgi:lysylphosphatidylglycerol synthetase-like protein (DUF2156 family)